MSKKGTAKWLMEAGLTNRDTEDLSTIMGQRRKPVAYCDSGVSAKCGLWYTKSFDKRAKLWKRQAHTMRVEKKPKLGGICPDCGYYLKWGVEED